MPTVAYIHGFLSSPQSTKAVQTKTWLSKHRPNWRFECPYLSAHPQQAKAELDTLMKTLSASDDDIYLIGSSLGGFWATYLTEKWGVKAVLINPSVKPVARMRALVGEPVKNYHTDESYILTDSDAQTLESCAPDTIRDTDLYWLMAQKGDEVLDFRDGVIQYQGCRQTIESGGNHGFEGFASWLPEIIDFFEN